MDLAAVERPAVGQREREAAHPHRGQEQRMVAGQLRDHDHRRNRRADRRREDPLRHTACNPCEWGGSDYTGSYAATSGASTQKPS